MKDYETVACIVCQKPSKGQIAAGNVKTREGEEILATFCSKRCYGRAPAYDEVSGYGPWRRWMGRTESPSVSS